MLLKIALTVFAVAWTGRCELLSDCEIGGFLLPNGTCVCHRYWNGEDSKCNRIRCMNGGYSQDETPHCACPSGYLGPHCDPVTLSQAPSSVFEKQSTFNVVVYNAFTDYWGKAGYDHFRQSVKSHLDVFDYAQFNMAIFREGGSDVDQYPSNVTLADKQSFLDQLYAEELSYPMQYACTPLPFYKPLYNFLTKLNTRDTAVTVVTQFPPADDDVHRNMLEELAVAFGIRVSLKIINPASGLLTTACTDM
ncbi:unnamed protein product [Heligmosomoides polygyrus]|uniref:EGF-like domain-containing protein n=1 Tax=Heligmosomoides polygyrus TaxID=6339 RepID=A0A3P8G022_HELPZ|nr:unnamed protein product [Heligmosomoides polygyrus]